MNSPVMAKRPPACPVADPRPATWGGKVLSGRPRKVTDQPSSAGRTRILPLHCRYLEMEGAPAQLHDLLKVAAYFRC